ncbi:NAD(P)H-dependent flavin oxidoreductase [Chloroflexota bacterium]
MKTRMTELFGIKYPIILAGMNWLTTPKLVSSVSNAGGLGVLGGGHYDAEDLRAAIRGIRELTDKPFGVNLGLRPSNRASVAVAIEEKVPVFNYTLSRPPDIIPLIKAVHEYGGKVIGTVAMLRHALRSEQLGVDMIQITSYEAAAHAGNVGAIVLIPAITSAVKVPCTAAGGFSDGKGLAAALALGTEGITMGTRLAATQETEVPDATKEMWLKATEEDTIFDPRFDGMLCRVIRNKAAEDMMKKRLPAIDAIWAALQLKQTMKLSFSELIRYAIDLKNEEPGPLGKRSLGSLMRFAVGSNRKRKAYAGDSVNGLLECGQTTGRVNDIPTVAEVIERTVAEAEEALELMKIKFSS